MRYQIPIHAGDHTCTAHVGAGLLANIGPVVAAALRRQARRAFIVADSRLPGSFTLAAAESLKGVGLSSRVVAVKPSEQEKSLASLERLLVEMARTRLERDDIVVAMGGGIVGDLAGFAAAVYRRGVPIVQCPTTLLAMVDASVGGKTGINLDTGEGPLAEPLKNLVGAFHHPHVVIADVDTLRSLPPRTLRCGLAECIKHGLLAGGAGDPGLFDWTRGKLASILSADPATLAELVSRNIALKARVVEQDEREQASDEAGGRALLNLGHTFGHALETLPGLIGHPGSLPGGLHHGEAVGIGLVAAATLGAAMGLTPPDMAASLRELLEEAGLPTRVDHLPEDGRIIDRMRHDKKVQASAMRFIVPLAGHAAKVVRDPPLQGIAAALQSVRL
ncbi:MAG: 3-dehydroquinate synthase [Phycisphaerales bacterium]|jgi:3-dehydroquinate synthetase